METEKTSFFQPLNAPTKIAHGTIEITSDLKLMEKDAKVGASEATLLNIKIQPWERKLWTSRGVSHTPRTCGQGEYWHS